MAINRQTDLVEYLSNLVTNLNQKIIEKQEWEENEKTKKFKEEEQKLKKAEKNIRINVKRKVKKDEVIEDFTSINNPFPTYRPRDWKIIYDTNGTELSYGYISKAYEKLRNRKIETLDENELAIVRNVRILKDCYCTIEPELRLANYFIGKFDFDPFCNPYALTRKLEYANNNILTLDGLTPQTDGFNLDNWPEDRQTIFVNPPFSRLPEAADKCDTVSMRENKPSIALIANMDYNNYVKKSFLFADYCIWLGRTQYKPMVGVSVTTPRYNSIMIIYNSKRHLENGNTRILMSDKEFYAFDLRNKKTLHLAQQILGLE